MSPPRSRSISRTRSSSTRSWDTDEPIRPFESREAMTREAQSLRREHNFAPDTAIRDVAVALRGVDESAPPGLTGPASRQWATVFEKTFSTSTPATMRPIPAKAAASSAWPNLSQPMTVMAAIPTPDQTA